MSTNNSVNVGLSGSTGTGSFVGSNSPTLVTPTLGAASATSLTFSSTTGIVGTTTNNDAAAGSVGEFISSIILQASAISISNGVNANITSISLTAGDWDVFGNFYALPSATFSSVVGWSNSVSATLPDAAYRCTVGMSSSTLASLALSIPYRRYSLSGTTTIYLSVQAAFGSGTATAWGGISARRVR